MFDAPNLQTGREDHANPSLKAPREENPKDSKQQEKKGIARQNWEFT